MKEEYFADDRVVIPDYIKRMSKEELEQEIARLESEIRKENEKNSALQKKCRRNPA